MIPRNLSHKLVALFAISCGIIENQLRLLLAREIIVDELEESRAVDFFEHTGLQARLELAYLSGIVDEGVYGLAEDVRQTRNQLVHNPVKRLSIQSVVALEDRVRKAVRAPDSLHDLIDRDRD